MNLNEPITARVKSPDKFQHERWKVHWHIATRAIRFNEFLGLQVVNFPLPEQRTVSRA